MVPVLVQHNTKQITCGWQCFAYMGCNGTPWLSDGRLHRAQNSRACFSALFLQFTVLHIYLDACGNDSNAVVVCMFACVRARVCVPLPPSISFFLTVFWLPDVVTRTSRW